jgi:hypothetical protein
MDMDEEATEEIRTAGGWGDDAFDPGWVVDDHFRLLSVTFNVRTTHRPLAESLGWHLAPFRRPRSGRRRFVVWVYPEDGAPHGSDLHQYVRNGAVRRTGSPGDLLNYVIWDLHALVSKRTRDFLLLHAGAVVREDRAVLFPAPPESGKSSLSIALLEEGFDYLSDELGAIDPLSGTVYPHAKRIWVTEGSLEFFPGLAQRLRDREGLGAELLKRYVRP